MSGTGDPLPRVWADTTGGNLTGYVISTSSLDKTQRVMSVLKALREQGHLSKLDANDIFALVDGIVPLL